MTSPRCGSTSTCRRSDVHHVRLPLLHGRGDRRLLQRRVHRRARHEQLDDQPRHQRDRRRRTTSRSTRTTRSSASTRRARRPCRPRGPPARATPTARQSSPPRASVTPGPHTRLLHDLRPGRPDRRLGRLPRHSRAGRRAAGRLPARRPLGHGRAVAVRHLARHGSSFADSTPLLSGTAGDAVGRPRARSRSASAGQTLRTDTLRRSLVGRGAAARARHLHRDGEPGRHAGQRRASSAPVTSPSPRSSRSRPRSPRARSRCSGRPSWPARSARARSGSG